MRRRVTAIILCGGNGERLRPLTDTLPKPLVCLRGRPILSYILDHLVRYDVRDVVIAAGFKAGMLRDFFAGNHRDLNVTIIDSGDVDIIERVRGCSPHVQGDFILLYGDTLADVNLELLQEFHLSHDLNATVTLCPFTSSFGLFELDDDKTVISYREKPTLRESINIGYCYYEQQAFPLMQDFATYIGFLEFLANQRMLKGFMHHGVHLTINTLRELDEAEQIIEQFEAMGK